MSTLETEPSRLERRTAMSAPPARRIPILSSLGRLLRLTRIEIFKLFVHKFFVITLALTLLVTVGLGFAGKKFSEDSQVFRFSNYGVWVTTAGFGLQVATILLVAQAAMSLSGEATARTLNTVLCRPLRRIEFVGAKILSLVFATVVLVALTCLAAFVVGGTIEPRAAPDRMMLLSEEAPKPKPHIPLTTYGPIVDPRYPDKEIAPMGEVVGSILFGFLLLVVPVLAAVSVGFLLGTLMDSAAMAIGVAIGLFLALETSKFIPMFYEFLGSYAYNYPISQIFTLMRDAGNGGEPNWDAALAGVRVAALYVAGFFSVSIAIFCRRDVTL